MKKWLMVCCLIPSLLYALPIEVPAKYYDTLVAYCNQYGVPIYYTSRLIAYESGWNAKHINKNTNGTVDKGLMQLNSAGLSDLARWHNGGKLVDPMDWVSSMRIGIMHLRYLHDRNGDSWWSAVAAYNMGETAYREWVAGKRALPAGTKKELDYVFQ